MEDVLNPKYWSQRIAQAKFTEEHHSIYLCSKDKWKRIEKRHEEILRQHVTSTTSILDVGCGWGRLLSLLPYEWIIGNALYLGIDLCEEFIQKAKHPLNDSRLTFSHWDVRNPLPAPFLQYDLAILVSFRPMIIRNAGKEVWEQMEKNIRQKAKKLLYLEYDETDPGSLE